MLHDLVLRPLLGVDDVRTDDRVAYTGGDVPISEVERRVFVYDTACKASASDVERRFWSVAFILYPISVEDVMRVADEGAVMPPKCTWFTPKLRSGIVVHTIDDDDCPEQYG